MRFLMGRWVGSGPFLPLWMIGQSSPSFYFFLFLFSSSRVSPSLDRSGDRLIFLSRYSRSYRSLSSLWIRPLRSPTPLPQKNIFSNLCFLDFPPFFPPQLGHRISKILPNKKIFPAQNANHGYNPVNRSET